MEAFRHHKQLSALVVPDPEVIVRAHILTDDERPTGGKEKKIF